MPLSREKGLIRSNACSGLVGERSPSKLDHIAHFIQRVYTQSVLMPFDGRVAFIDFNWSTNSQLNKLPLQRGIFEGNIFTSSKVMPSCTFIIPSYDLGTAGITCGDLYRPLNVPSCRLRAHLFINETLC